MQIVCVVVEFLVVLLESQYRGISSSIRTKFSVASDLTTVPLCSACSVAVGVVGSAADFAVDCVVVDVVAVAVPQINDSGVSVAAAVGHVPAPRCEFSLLVAAAVVRFVFSVVVVVAAAVCLVVVVSRLILSRLAGVEA